MQFITSFALLAAAATCVFAQGPQINTPASVVECEPTQLTFSGGTAPYIISALPGGQITAPPLEVIGTGVTGTSLTWNTDLASTTSITIQIKDSTGQTAYSAIVTIQAGSTTTCVGKNSGTSGSTTGTASGTAPVSSASSAAGASSVSSGVSSPATVTTAPSATKASSAAGSTASGSTKPASATSAGASAATSSSSAAMTVNSGWASGFIGMLLAALIA